MGIRYVKPLRKPLQHMSLKPQAPKALNLAKLSNTHYDYKRAPVRRNLLLHKTACSVPLLTGTTLSKHIRLSSSGFVNLASSASCSLEAAVSELFGSDGSRQMPPSLHRSHSLSLSLALALSLLLTLSFSGALLFFSQAQGRVKPPFFADFSGGWPFGVPIFPFVRVRNRAATPARA